MLHRLLFDTANPAESANVGAYMRAGSDGDLISSTLVGGKEGLDVNVINSSIAVSATDLDIRDLSAAQDSVESWLFDGAGTALTSTLTGGKQSLDVYVSGGVIDAVDNLINVAISTHSNTVTTSSAALLGTPLANRKHLFLYNNGNKEVFIGPSGVSTANGFPMFPGSILEIALGPSVVPHAVSAAGSQDIRSLQGS